MSDYRDATDECPCCDGSGQVTAGEALNITQMRWIPVSERLPKQQNCNVLVRYVDKYQDTIDRAHFGVSGFVGRSFPSVDLVFQGPQSGAVTHWMPLPDPPGESV